MCGICGILARGDRPESVLPPLRRMTDTLRHRGPDDEGYLLAYPTGEPARAYGGDTTAPRAPEAEPLGHPHQHVAQVDGSAARLALGHRRLSILDLSPLGHQPMCTPDRRYWIVYNGEIYNYRDIARDLESSGETFASRCDTEVILRAYALEGPAFLRRVNGMFALAIWDDREKTLFCARDRIGIKPFYYHLSDDLFVFASDIKTIIASRLYEPRVDPEALYHCLTLGVAPRPTTCFDGVRALEQGHWMKITRQGIVAKECYWRLPVGTQDARLSEVDAAAQLDDALQQAVERRLLADVDVGTFMSGGIDSTTVSAIAAQAHPGIRAFTLGFAPEYREMDELPQAKATAAMYGMTHHIRQVRPESVLTHVREMIRCYEEPFFSLSPNHVISQFVAENGIKVVLNGLGGDELFGGYPYYRWALRWPRLRALAPFARMLAPLGFKWRQLAELASAHRPEEAYTALYGHEPQSRKRRLYAGASGDYDTPRRLRSLYNPDGIAFSDPVEAFNYLDMMHYVGNHHVYRVDQFTMLFSLEGRVPLLDHELVELAFRIPSRLKVRGNTPKYILRRVAERWIHPSCLSMRKRGFSLAMHRWIHTDLKPLVRESLDRLKARDLFDAEAIERARRDVEAGRAPYSSVWQLAAVELWLQEMFERSGIAPAGRAPDRPPAQHPW